MIDKNEVIVEMIRDHLRKVPKDLSPNKDYLLGIMDGINAVYSMDSSDSNSVMESEFRKAMEEEQCSK